MRDYLTSLKIEFFKIKGTLIYALVALIPLFIAGLSASPFLSKNEMTMKGDPWIELVNNSLLLWAVMGSTLFITLLTGLMGNIEHKDNNDKKLFSYPQSRISIYLSKLTVALSFVFVANVLLLIFTLLTGFAINALHPHYHLVLPIPFLEVGRILVKVFAVSLGVVAFHHFLAQYWTNIIVPFTVGAVMTFATFIIMQSEYIRFYPWIYTAIGTKVDFGATYGTVFLYNMILFAASLVVGTWLMKKKEII